MQIFTIKKDGRITLLLYKWNSGQKIAPKIKNNIANARRRNNLKCVCTQLQSINVHGTKTEKTKGTRHIHKYR